MNDYDKYVTEKVEAARKQVAEGQAITNDEVERKMKTKRDPLSVAIDKEYEKTMNMINSLFDENAQLKERILTLEARVEYLETHKNFVIVRKIDDDTPIPNTSNGL